MASAKKQQEHKMFLQSHGLEHLPSLWTKQRAWSAAWLGESPEAKRLREKLSNNGKRYRARFRPDEQDMLRIMTVSMQYFTEMQVRMLKRDRYDQLLQKGEAALESLVQGLLAGEAWRDYDFASIDFEGSDTKGITEFGVTRLYPGKLSTPETGKDCLHSRNYILRAKNRHNHVFGTSTRLSSELLPRTILQELTPSQPCQHLILIGHGIHSDLHLLESLGLQSIPSLAGIVDTSLLAKKLLNKNTNLEDLLKDPQTRVPFHWRHLHCAGNDARYTMQAMLALLHLREAGRPEVMECLQGLLVAARQPLREKERREAGKAEMEEFMIDGLFREA